jgi:quinol monooxygenase YgiN
VTITVRAELNVPTECRPEFVEVARALAAAAADEPGTLRYEWYDSADPTVLVVIEEYRDGRAALAHNEHCAELLGRVAQLAEPRSVHLHGEAGPELEAWTAERPFVCLHRPLF